MSGWTDAGEVDVLEYYFRATAATAASHLALLTTTPTADSGAGAAECTGGAYARVAFARSTGNWAAASGTAPVTIANAAAVNFPTATGTWGGNVVGWAYYDAATAGNMLAFGALATSKSVGNGDKPSFAIGDLVFKLGDPGDTYT